MSLYKNYGGFLQTWCNERLADTVSSGLFPKIFSKSTSTLQLFTIIQNKRVLTFCTKILKIAKPESLVLPDQLVK
jgi:hypothetical protein